jgi:SPP1 gp7 family putative phage head morphogenesis protein
MVQEIYRLQGTDGTINQIITKFFADKIWTAVVKGYGNDIPTVEYDSPDYNMLVSLKRNVWQFSSAKNYQQLRALSDALIGEDGQLRTFQQFKSIANSINEKFVKVYLETEYNLAVAGGQMAGKWVTIHSNSTTFPLLQFDVVIDSQTTDICRPLDGIIVPVDHPMLNSYYPPNHYGCRTTIRQLTSGKVTPDEKIALPEIPKMFRTNLAKQGLIFPEDHPYFIGIPQDIKNQFKG